MSTKAGSALRLYRFVCLLASPLILGHLIWRTLSDGGLTYLKQRLGFFHTIPAEPLWVHAASVGEVNTIAPLLSQLMKRYPDIPVLVTTNTPTGKAAVLKLFGDSVTHRFLPLDFSSCVKRFLRHTSIQAGIITETEIWPLLLWEVSFPVCIVNGRLSQKTLRHVDGLFGNTYRLAIRQLTQIFARSDKDADSFLRMGADPKRVSVIGNLKFSTLEGKTPNNKPVETDSLAILPRDYCLLASTHDDEELRIARAWLQEGRQEELLVIAPRHPERMNRIVRKLRELDTNIAIRSRGDTISPKTTIYIADTLGEMNNWFMGAIAIFMGGSLVSKGGHNMLEPARLGKAVITGPHTQNFLDEVKMLNDAGAITIVENEACVVRELLRACTDQEDQRRMGEKAAAAVKTSRDMDSRYLDAITALLEIGSKDN